MKRTWIVLLMGILFWMGGMAIALEPVHAQSLFANPQGFTLTQACNATTSISRGTAPVPLTVGETYPALGENKQPGGTHAYIRVGGQLKWVSLSCGSFSDEPIDVDRSTTSPFPTSRSTARRSETSRSETSRSEFLPFFDNEDNPIDLTVGGIVDVTPPPPILDSFDEAVVQVCGEPGKVVSRDEFKDLMRSHEEVLAAVQSFTANRVFGDPLGSSEDYLDELTDAWFNIQGFDHIFCGEPDRGKIGGLHFHGRYLDLQNRGLAGRIANNELREEVDPGAIYTLGVEMLVDGRIVRSPVKGYGYTLSATDILKFGTKALADNSVSGDRSTACKLPIDDDGETFTVIFVRRSNGIRTFYPDATPSARDTTCAVD